MSDSELDDRGLAAVRMACGATRGGLAERLDGLTDEEFHWEPVDGCWGVRATGSGSEVTWVVDPIERDVQPAPVTTIAWRLWHISVDCLESYCQRAFGRRATDLDDEVFVGTATEGVELVLATFDHFVACLDERADQIGQPLGPQFGPYAEANYLDLALHMLREVNHHGGEVGLLRDLWFHKFN